MKLNIRAFLAERVPDLRDYFDLIGLICVVYGVAQLHMPAAWIVGGSILFWLGMRR